MLGAGFAGPVVGSRRGHVQGVRLGWGNGQGSGKDGGCGDGQSSC